MAKQENFFKRKKVTAAISAFALLSGFIFLNQSVTGNVVLDNSSGFNPISFIGLLLVFLAVILALYTIKKK